MRFLVPLLLLLAPLALAPTASAAVPNGCSFVATAYHCVAEDASGDDCANEGATGSSFTGVGAGLGGIAGAGAAGAEWCSPNSSSEYVTASASVGVVYVNLGWTEGEGGGAQCFAWIYVNSLPHLLVPCVAGGPPNPGWGRLLP